MKGQNFTARTPEQWLSSWEEPRRAELIALDALIRRTLPKLERVVLGGLLGYGPFHYRYASGREGDACKLSLASNAQYVSLYCLAADEQGYVAERHRDALPKAKIGKSCVRFKRLADLDQKALVKLLKETAKTGYAG